MEELKTINEVCKMLDMTSRTIRYYEQLRLITTVRENKTVPRRLDAENIGRLRKIRFLRKLGLTLDEISKIIDSDEQATEFITSKIAEMKAEINSMIVQVNLLREVVTVAEQGGDIYSVEKQLDQPPDEPEMFRIAAEVTKLIVERRFSELKPFLNNDLNRMPPGFFEVGWDVHIESCGAFISIGKQKIIADTVINRLHFEKQDVAICIEVHAGLVTDMFLQYWKEDN
ncbi:MAG: MerR family transcriptional regulator [Ruminococcus sp.]|nr:MerR family transcriptional regulator [Ruminococcus sp.]